MQIDIQKILEAIALMTPEELNQIMEAIEARLDELDAPGDPTAQVLRQAIRAARKRTDEKRGGNSIVAHIKKGMRATLL